MAIKRRRLGDLYVRGAPLEVNDGDGSVTVWLQKLNPVDRDTAFRRAQAARARFMIDADDEDSEQFQAMYAQIRSIGHDRDELVRLAISEEVNNYRERATAERALDEESWGKEGYLQGLMDAWAGTSDEPGLSSVINEDPEDAEAKRVGGEIDRFEREVTEMVDSEIERLMKDWVDVPDDQLWRRCAHRMLELNAIQTYNEAYNSQALFFGVREPENHAKRYFGSVAEVADLSEEVRTVLLEKLGELTVDHTQGKSLPVTPASSNSSAPSPEAEASPPSGPKDASA